MLLVLFGFGMFALGGIMLFKPMAFANGIPKFSSKSWFHSFEIAGRLYAGISPKNLSYFTNFELKV